MAYITKLDLNTGYYQIILREETPKTNFITHDKHYEILVMPFELTNSPSTFQSFINKKFRHYLRKFVLVLFNDILIYRKSCEEHIKHVDHVLEMIQNDQLYVERSKCAFGKQEVE